MWPSLSLFIMTSFFLLTFIFFQGPGAVFICARWVLMVFHLVVQFNVVALLIVGKKYVYGTGMKLAGPSDAARAVLSAISFPGMPQ